MQKRKSLSVGICAYNEQANIKALLKDVLGQDYGVVKLKEIIIASDGSTDKTKEIVTNLKNEKINFLDFKDNTGKSLRINDILKTASGDILVLLDADIKIASKKSIIKLISPLLNDSKLSLVSGRQEPILSNNVISNIALRGDLLWKEIELTNSSNSVYQCSGGNRAMTRKLYTNIVFPEIMAEDVYPYLYSVKHGYSFKYVPETIIYYKTPATLKDYIKRETRYQLSPYQNKKLFGKDLVNSEFHIDRMVKLKILIKHFIKYPIWIGLYLLIVPVYKISRYFVTDKYSARWKSVSSTKNIYNYD